MAALCSMASCGMCGMCTAEWERDDVDDSDTEVAKHLASVEPAIERQALENGSPEDEEPPF